MPVPQKQIVDQAFAFNRTASLQPLFLKSASIFIVLIIWETAGRISNSMSLPTFLDTAVAFYRLVLSGRLPLALLHSSSSMIVGLLLALVVGNVLGLLIGWSRLIERCLTVYLTIMLAIPMMAMIPVFIVIFGLGLGSRIAVVFVFAVPIIIINVATGVRTVDRNLVLMADSFGATRLQLLKNILLPGASPAILAAVRLGIGRAIVGMIAAEMLVVAVGFGSLLLEFGATMKPQNSFAVLLTVIGVSVAVMALAQRVEKRLTPWARLKLRDY
ncbi:MAG: ABC transporter permease [Firmicutes bacterium]|nr:ABC transporter permease [Bacillota bacterium]